MVSESSMQLYKQFRKSEKTFIILVKIPNLVLYLKIQT